MDTIFEIDDIDTHAEEAENVTEDVPVKPKKEPKIKKKKEMSEDRKEKLREQLSRGRKTIADKRAKAKLEKSQQEPKVATTTKKEDNIKIQVKPQSNNNDDLRNEISELKKLILEGRKPREEIKKEIKKPPTPPQVKHEPPKPILKKDPY